MEDRIIELIDQVTKQGEAVKKERGLPQFLEGEYAEAADHAGKALKAFRRGDIRKTKIFFHAANTYREKAERDWKEARELGEKMADLLKGT